MTSSEPALSILVALDTHPLGSGILELAVRLASQRRAQLRGLFVQDVNLLRLTALPFTRQISLWSRNRPVSFQSLRTDMEVTAAAVREALARLAAEERLEWSFEVVEGSLLRVLIETSEQADIVMLVRQGMTVYATDSSLPAQPSAKPTVVLFEDADSSAPVLQAALQLDAEQPDRIFVLLGPADQQRLPQLRMRVAEICGEKSCRVTVLPDPIMTVEQLREAVQYLAPGLILMSRESNLIDRADLATFASRVGCPLALFR
jgi:hypothetical protein